MVGIAQTLTAHNVIQSVVMVKSVEMKIAMILTLRLEMDAMKHAIKNLDGSVKVIASLSAEMEYS